MKAKEIWRKLWQECLVEKGMDGTADNPCADLRELHGTVMGAGWTAIRIRDGHCYYTPEGNRCRLLPLEEKTENYEHYILSEDDRQDPSIKDKKQKLWYDILNKQIREHVDQDRPSPKEEGLHRLVFAPIGRAGQTQLLLWPVLVLSQEELKAHLETEQGKSFDQEKHVLVKFLCYMGENDVRAVISENCRRVKPGELWDINYRWMEANDFKKVADPKKKVYKQIQGVQLDESFAAGMGMAMGLSTYDRSTDAQGAIRVPPVILYQPITNDVPALDPAVLANPWQTEAPSHETLVAAFPDLHARFSNDQPRFELVARGLYELRLHKLKNNVNNQDGQAVNNQEEEAEDGEDVHSPTAAGTIKRRRSQVRAINDAADEGMEGEEEVAMGGGGAEGGGSPFKRARTGSAASFHTARHTMDNEERSVHTGAEEMKGGEKEPRTVHKYASFDGRLQAVQGGEGNGKQRAVRSHAPPTPQQQAVQLTLLTALAENAAPLSVKFGGMPKCNHLAHTINFIKRALNREDGPGVFGPKWIGLHEQTIPEWINERIEPYSQCLEALRITELEGRRDELQSDVAKQLQIIQTTSQRLAVGLASVAADLTPDLAQVLEDLSRAIAPLKEARTKLQAVQEECKRAEAKKQELYEHLGGCGPTELAASLKGMWAQVQATATQPHEA